MDSGVPPRDKTPKSGVAHCKLSPSQESENDQIQNQIDAHMFFFWTLRGSSTRNLCHQDKLSIKLFIVSPWKTQENGGTCATRLCTQLDAALRQRVTRQSPSVNIWQKKHSCGSSAPYSPDLSPCDFVLFSRLKNHLKVRHFGTLDSIQKSVTGELKGIPAEAFQHCYEQWKQCLRRCVAAQGNYFEGDNLDL